jgi:hypothetical protein
MKYKFILIIEAEDEGEAEEKISDMTNEQIRDNLVCED